MFIIGINRTTGTKIGFLRFKLKLNINYVKFKLVDYYELIK